MPRSILDDALLACNFHLIDVDFSLSLPPFVLMPTVGFSSITSPEMTLETKEVNEGTDDFIHHMLGKATASPIVLQRGVSAFNSDFWRWVMACTRGDPPTPPSLASLIPGNAPPIPGKRRDMLLLHLTSISSAAALEAAGSSLKGAALAGIGAAVFAANTVVDTLSGGLLDLGISRLPGKAYMLYGCLPTRYKVGSDFDAESSEVSLEELEMVPHRFEELSILG